MAASVGLAVVALLHIHYLQHVPYESPGSIAEWAQTRGHSSSSTRFYADDPLPALDRFDWLVVMGGPMGVYEESAYPWLVPEKAFIRAAIDAGKTVLGICLGSQLIAEVLGGRVAPAAEKEIGWWPVRKTPAGLSHPLLQAMPAEFTVLHWHGDTWTLPAGAQLLASSDGCANQAFVWGEKVVGFQFHMEATEAVIEAFLTNGATPLPTDQRFVQSPAAIRQRYSLAESGNRVMAALLDQLAGSQG